MMRRRNEHGAVLVFALLIATVLGAAYTALRSGTDALATSDARYADRLTALYAAQGGVQAARAALRHDPSYRGAELGIGRCRIDISVLAEAGATSRWRVRVRASLGGRRAAGIDVLLAATAPDALPAIVSWQES